MTESKAKNCKELVKSWQKEYPTCSIRKAALGLGIDRDTVTKYWNKDLDKRENRDYKSEVLKWQHANKNQTKVACARELGIYKGTVAKYWNKDLVEVSK